MRIHSVKLVNYKSIGEELAEVIIEPKVTTIIGKNESGKSNVLEGISRIRFFGDMSSAFNEELVNRNNGVGANIQYIVTLVPTVEEATRLGSDAQTTVTLTKDTFSVAGALLDFYAQVIIPLANEFKTITGNNPLDLKDTALHDSNTHMRVLSEQKPLNLRRYQAAMTFFEARLKKIKSEKAEEIRSAFDLLNEQWMFVKGLFPVFFYRRNARVLKQKYTYDEVQKELESPQEHTDSLLSAFVKVIGVSAEEFLLAAKSGRAGPQVTVRARITRAIENNINRKFNG